MPIQDQRQAKLETVRSLHADAEFRETFSTRLRDRADLTWVDGQLGLFSLAHDGSLVAIDSCPMMTPALEDFFQIYRERVPPFVRRGSVRLRISPSGERGVWLDFANVDVRDLLAEGEYLRWLSQIATVEIGQRRKALEFIDGHAKITAPNLRPWFETFGANDHSIPLYGVVGGFSQSGFLMNRALVETVADQVKQTGLTEWADLFCGAGNFTLALADRGHFVRALELDELALEGLRMAQQTIANQTAIQVERADIYRMKDLASAGWLVDPPRSGLRGLLDVLATSESPPRAIIYVSCFTPSFRLDVERLATLGYELQSLIGVDQFAQTPHAEWVGTFRKKS